MKKLFVIFFLFTCFIITSCHKEVALESFPESGPELVAKAKTYVESNFPKKSDTDLGLSHLEADWKNYSMVKNSDGHRVLNVPITNVTDSGKVYTELAFILDDKGAGNAIIKKYVGEFTAKEIELTIYSIDGKRIKKGVYNTATGKFRRWYDLTKIKNNAGKLKTSGDRYITEEVRMECPEGLMYNPTIKLCDWPHKITDDWASPYFWMILFSDGTTDTAPYGNELDEVIVYPPSGAPGWGGGGGSWGGFPVGPGGGSGSGGGSGGGGGYGGGGSGQGGGSGSGSDDGIGSGYTTEQTDESLVYSGTVDYNEEDFYNDNGISRAKPFDFWLSVEKTRETSTGLVSRILYVTPIPKRPIDEYYTKYGERVVRIITVLPSTIWYTATPLTGSFLIEASFRVNVVYQYYDGGLCTNVKTRQYQRTGSCVVW